MSEQIQIDESTVFNPSTGELGSLPEITLRTNKDVITDESPIIITWTISNARSAKLNNEDVALEGNREFTSNQDLKIHLLALNQFGSSERELLVPIDSDPPSIISFRTDSDFAIEGFPITLSWDVRKAKKIEINSGVGDVTEKSSIIITAGSRSVYKITVYSYFGYFSEAEVRVTLFPTPLINGIFIPEPRFNFSYLNESQPNFNFECNLTMNTTINLPAFAFLNDLGNKVYLNKSEIAPSNTTSFIKILIELKREVSRLINSLWREHHK